MTYDKFNPPYGYTYSVYLVSNDMRGRTIEHFKENKIPGKVVSLIKDGLLEMLDYELVVPFNCGYEITEIRGIVPCLN